MPQKPTLFLLVGYPGSGKTTASKYIHELTGAIHLWADKMRRERFGDPPTYSISETRELYDHLNQVADELLATGQSVIYDTNFNFAHDRDKLHKIADQNGANTMLIWVKTPLDIARKRATDHPNPSDTRVFGNMPENKFAHISSNLQEPTDIENPIILDGTKLTAEYIKSKLRI